MSDTCAYKDPDWEHQGQRLDCGRPRRSDDPKGYCILHSSDPRRDCTEFVDEVIRSLANRKGDFNGCNVPAGTIVDLSVQRLEPLPDFTATIWNEHSQFILGQRHLDGHVHLRFHGASFHDGVVLNLAGASFAGRLEVDLGGATFLDGSAANLSSCTFAGGARLILSQCRFEPRTELKMNSCTLREMVWINDDHQSGPLFAGVLQCRGANFECGATFMGSDFAERSTFEGVDLRNVTFRNCSLARTSLRNAISIEDAEFDNVRWATPAKQRKQRRASWRVAQSWRRLVDEANRVTIQDEVDAMASMSNEKITSGFAAAERVYRGLKKSYEKRADHPRAAEFHYGEMEMRRGVESQDVV
ncbi:MAG: pentapeptide repeat-containing protein [Chloroflexi bacterium]|nr:pentapeptide repeat-containing protein [Chloroflexota bacterium]